MKAKNERVLSYGMSTKVTEERLANISAAGTSNVTGHGTYSQTGGGADGDFDVNYDL